MDFRVTKEKQDDEKEQERVVSAEIYFERGSRYLALKKYKEAIENFQKALELDKGDFETRFNLAVTYFILENMTRHWKCLMSS